MALTKTDLDNLDLAIATAELEVEVDGRRTKFRTVQELLDARKHVEGVLRGSTPGAAGGLRRVTFTTQRGF